MNTDLEPYQGGTPEPYVNPLAESMRAQMDLIKAQIMPPRVDQAGKVIGPATDDETALAIAQAAARGVDLLANQGRLVRNKQGVVELWRTWEGLVVVAQRTGEWGGVEATLYTDGRKQAAQNRWGKIVEQYVWQDAWDSDDPPVACTVGIWRKGAARPSWGIAHYSTWGTEPDPDGWSDKLVNGRKVMNKWGKPVRVHNGVRVPKASEWWKMPKAIHQLAIAALRNALKAEFQPDTLRKATMAAAGKLGLDRDERLELASDIVGRDVDTFNDLDPTEYAEVYDELVGRAPVDTSVVDVEDTTASIEHPASEAQAGPLSPKAAGPADSTAPQGSAGQSASESPTPESRQVTGAPPAEHHPQGSAGDEAPLSGSGPGSHEKSAAPAEHHTAGVLGEVAPADGTVPAGKSRSDTGLPPGAAPAKPTPTRKRRPTDPTGAPNVTEAMKEAQQFRDERKTQTVVEHPPADPIQAMPPKFRELYLKHFGNELEPALATVRQYVAAWSVAGKYPATGDGAPWSLELLRELAADTFEKDKYQ